MADKFLFLHGWATDARVWDETAKALGVEYLNPDLPGHGNNLPWDSPTLASALRVIEKSLFESGGLPSNESIGGSPVIAVGWSLGAQALLSYAYENAGAFKALVLVGATPRFTATGDFPHGQPRPLVKRMIMDMEKDPVETLKRFYALNFTNEELTLPDAKAFLERYLHANTAQSNTPNFKYNEITVALEALYKNDLRHGLSRLDIPCLIAHGTSDDVCPIEAGKFLATHIKNAKFVEFDGAGHAPFITQPERFAGILKDFAKGL